MPWVNWGRCAVDGVAPPLIALCGDVSCFFWFCRAEQYFGTLLCVVGPFHVSSPLLWTVPDGFGAVYESGIDVIGASVGHYRAVVVNFIHELNSSDMD